MVNLAIIEECMTRGWKRSMAVEKDCRIILEGKHGCFGRDVKLKQNRMHSSNFDTGLRNHKD